MEKIISYTLGPEGVFPEDFLCGGVQGEHRATAVEVTPTLELAEALSAFKAEGKSVEVSFEAVLSSGERVEAEKRTGEELFAPFYLTEPMTSSGLDLSIIVSLLVKGDKNTEICTGIIKLYFTPCPAGEFGTFNREEESRLEERAEEIIAELEAKGERYEESVSLKAQTAAASAEVAARHLKRVEQLAKEAEDTRTTLENGMELAILGGGADAVLPAIPDGENKLLMSH